ncbi:MAG: L-lactate permease [Verrucomicrobiales bacterium]
MLALAVTLPFLLLLLLTLVLRRPLWQGAATAFALALVLWLRVPSVGAEAFAAPVVKALVVSCEVGLILVGAIAFLDYMHLTGTTGRIKEALGRFTSGNAGLEALLLAWLFCGFLEGAAGFGAPAALVAPLLTSLGFPAVIAAVLPLIGDSAAVPFGAVGTPVRIGFDGLPAESAAHYGAGINVLAGLVAPLAIYALATLAGPNETRAGLGARGLGLSVWAGLCFTVPAFALVWIGPEFPSLGGSLAGLLLFCLTLAKLPRVDSPSGSPVAAIGKLVKAFAPYLLVCALLLVGKLLLGGVQFSLAVSDREQTVGAFQPGLMFLLAITLLALRRRDKPAELVRMLAGAGKRLPRVWLAIFCMAALAQLVVQIGDPGEALAALFAGDRAIVLLLVLAPIAGAVGSFIAGSATVSNLLFAPFLVQASVLAGADPGLVLGLQLAGAGAGNMVSLQNLAAVQATVGLVDREREMLRHLWWPCAIYLALAILMGLGIARFL